jgi:uncharacterized peroxidase-related enzyme
MRPSSDRSVCQPRTQARRCEIHEGTQLRSDARLVNIEQAHGERCWFELPEHYHESSCLFRMVSSSPAALQGYVGMLGALGKGALSAATQERIALAIAEFNACDYCLSAHTYLATHVAKLDESEVAANRSGSSNDAKADAAVRFASKVAQLRGHVGDADIRAVRTAGYADGEIVEIVQHVALNIWTNYVNSVARTQIDFPVVTARRVA